MTDAELFTIIKSVDPQAVRLPPGIRAIAAAISAVKDAEIDRLRSRKVAKTLCDEIELLRDKLEKATTENVMLLGELENARSNDRCTFGYLSEIRNAAGHVGDFPSLVQAVHVLTNKTPNGGGNRLDD